MRPSWTRGPAALLTLALLAPGAGAQGLSLVQRFGPDGMPFTHDDPLAVGASASGVRYAAMAADSCGEEEGLVGNFRSAHGHQGSHPDRNSVFTLPPEGERGALDVPHRHKARPQPADMTDDPVNDLVLQAPYDWTVWIAGMNLDDGQMTRHRAFPTDDHWTDKDTEDIWNRGWVTGWLEDEQEMNEVHASGAPVKDLHIDALGLSYRDVKPNDGWGFTISWDTLSQFDFPGKDKFNRLDLLAQQAFVQAWVSEIIDLNTAENGISGNFVADVAGVEPMGSLDFVIDKGLLCKVTVRNLPIVAGGPVGFGNQPLFPPELTMVQLQTEYTDWPQGYLAGTTIYDFVFDNAELSGLCTLAPELARSIGRGIAAGKFQKLDDIIAFVGDDDYANIGLYSGLAGREHKSPNDKLGLGLLEHGGQFKPAYWLKWTYLGENPVAAIGFDQGENQEAIQAALSDTVTESATKVLREQEGWRYNFGNTYMAKSMMLYGASSAGRTGSSPEWPTPVPIIERDLAPDILESFAKMWLHVRQDVIDPFLPAELYPNGVDWTPFRAGWKNFDALITHEGDDDQARPWVPVDWPPPNYNFGKAQVSSFRTSSGGEPKPQGTLTLDGEPRLEPLDVFSDTVMQWNGLISVDPVERTFSVCAVGMRVGADPNDPRAFSMLNVPQTPGNLLGWTTPQPLSQLPSWLENSSGRRWLTAAANHVREPGAEIRWMWDFERDGQVDSEHAQHMSDLGNTRMAAVFAYQSDSLDGVQGRTGFSLVPVLDDM